MDLQNTNYSFACLFTKQNKNTNCSFILPSLFSRTIFRVRHQKSCDGESVEAKMLPANDAQGHLDTGTDHLKFQQVAVDVGCVTLPNVCVMTWKTNHVEFCSLWEDFDKRTNQEYFCTESAGKICLLMLLRAARGMTRKPKKTKLYSFMVEIVSAFYSKIDLEGK